METDSDVPVPVSAGAIPAGVSITQIAAGGSHTLALGSDGHLYAWGENINGQLGNGTTSGTDSTSPVAVSAGAIPAGVSITQISAGAFYSLALGSDGHVYGWGNNASGNLGNGTTTPVSVSAPVVMSAGAIPTGVTITQISAGQDHSLMLGSDGHVYATGSNAAGELGDGSATPSSSSPVAVSAGAIPTGVTIIQISAGFSHSLALGSDGHVYAWGSNINGQLGNGTTTSAPVNTPVAVSAGAIPVGVSLTQISAGGHHSLALGSDAHVYAWGRNGDGELGNGSVTNADSDSPVAVSAGAVPVGVSLTQIFAGFLHSLALGSDGRVYTWGNNGHGQLGNGTRDTAPSSNTPVAISQPAGSAIGLAASGSSANHILALVAGTATINPGPPSATIVTPPDGASYTQGQLVNADYSCSAGSNGGVLKPGAAGCSGSVANRSPIDTSSAGPHTFTVTASDTDGQTATATSRYNVNASSSTAHLATPVNQTLPRITGKPRRGARLSCSTGTWANGPTSFAFRWSRDGTPIQGAGNSTYRVATSDEGLGLTCTVTASNSAGQGPRATSQRVTVPVPFVRGCPRATGGLRDHQLGLAKLGATRAQARKGFTHSSDRGKRFEDFFCLTPIGVRVGYASTSLLKTLSSAVRKRVQGRVVWASTSNAFYSLRGIRPGATLAAAAQALGTGAPFHVGLNFWYLAPNGNSTAILKVRNGIVEEIGIADSRLTKHRRAQLAFVNSFS
jgi:alpha-tubulin suppressor-like RCC1 family protein